MASPFLPHQRNLGDGAERVEDRLVLGVLVDRVGAVHVSEHALSIDDEERSLAARASVVRNAVRARDIEVQIAQVRE